MYVFIHGGGLVNGSSNQANAAPLVRRTGIVAVTFNYRLGALGFLAHPKLTRLEGESGNYGLMDQQAALRWVHRNIARFGGDPGSVTIGGESAGGWSVCAHLVATGSRRLFDKAILQSGSCPSRTQEEAEAVGRSLAAAVGCPHVPDPLNCLRRTPVGALIDAPSSTFPAPVRGTHFLPRDPRAAISTGHFRQVPIVIGANRDEGRTFSAGNIGWTKRQYAAWVRQSFPSTAGAVLATYPWPARSDKFTGAYLTGAIITDSGLIAGSGAAPTASSPRTSRTTPAPGSTSSTTAPAPV